MKMPRSLKLLILAFTLWQPLYLVGFLVLVMTGAPSEAGFHTLMTVHMATMIANIALLVFYVVHVFKAPTVASDRRALWAVALFFGAPIAMPIYFFAHVWPDETRKEAWSMDHVIR